MAADGRRTGRWWVYGYMAVDALAYAAVVALGTLAVALLVGIATGGGLVHAKLLLFLAGWLYLGIATVRLWPRSPARAGNPDTGASPVIGGDDGATRIEQVAAVAPPLRWMDPPPRRLSPPTKLLVASLVVLCSSFLLEAVFAVGQ